LIWIRNVDNLLTILWFFRTSVKTIFTIKSYQTLFFPELNKMEKFTHIKNLQKYILITLKIQPLTYISRYQSKRLHFKKKNMIPKRGKATVFCLRHRCYWKSPAGFSWAVYWKHSSAFLLRHRRWNARNSHTKEIASGRSRRVSAGAHDDLFRRRDDAARITQIEGTSNAHKEHGFQYSD